MGRNEEGGVWRRAAKDWAGAGWLVRGVVLPVIGLILGVAFGKWHPLNHYQPWLPGLIGALGAPLVWGVVTFIVTLAKTPGRLLREGDAEILRLEALLSENLDDVADALLLEPGHSLLSPEEGVLEAERQFKRLLQRCQASDKVEADQKKLAAAGRRYLDLSRQYHGNGPLQTQKTRYVIEALRSVNKPPGPA